MVWPDGQRRQTFVLTFFYGVRTAHHSQILTGFRVWGLGFRIRDLEFRVSGLGFRVQGWHQPYALVLVVDKTFQGSAPELMSHSSEFGPVDDRSLINKPPPFKVLDIISIPIIIPIKGRGFIHQGSGLVFLPEVLSWLVV